MEKHNYDMHWDVGLFSLSGFKKALHQLMQQNLVTGYTVKAGKWWHFTRSVRVYGATKTAVQMLRKLER